MMPVQTIQPLRVAPRLPRLGFQGRASRPRNPGGAFALGDSIVSVAKSQKTQSGTSATSARASFLGFSWVSLRSTHPTNPSGGIRTRRINRIWRTPTRELVVKSFARKG